MKEEPIMTLKIYRDEKTGIAWVSDGSCVPGVVHPSIHYTGSVAGMRNLGYWGKHDRCVRSHGYIYNIDKRIDYEPLDKIAAMFCKCEACEERRNNGNNERKGGMNDVRD